MNDTITIDGVIYSGDKKVLIKYPEEKQEETFHVPDFVEELGAGCFSDNEKIKNIFIGEKVRKIGERAFDCHNFNVKKVFIPNTVIELIGEIFGVGVDDGGCYYPVEIVGGTRASKIEFYCNERGIPFVDFDSDNLESFYQMEVEELINLAKEQAESNKEFTLSDSENGFQLKFADGELEVFAIHNTEVNPVVIKQTRIKLNKFHRDRVTKIIIGKGIAEISDFAFDDYNNLETIIISEDVCKISSTSFTGREDGDSRGCPNLSSFAVNENNKYYKSVGGVLHTFDMQTIVTYPPAKPELYYEIVSNVKNIGTHAFKRAKNLQCLKVGENCDTIEDFAFLNAFSLRHVYFASKTIKWPEYFPFIEMMGYDRPYRLGIIFAGPKDSEVQQKCSDETEYFLDIEGEELANFLAVPVPEKDEDKYMQDCLKMMIVSKDGILEQVGEFGDELILPEGVVRTRCRINLSKCKKVVIPSTMGTLWLEGLDGPAPDLKEFMISPKNEEFYEREGHLYYTPLNLIMYAPGVKNYGVIPEGTEAIREGAFRLIPAPMEKLYLPGSLSLIQPQCVRGGWFYEAEISPDNIDFKAIDGSIYTIDGKELIRAKISKDGFVVSEGTESIAEGALNDVYGSVTIPAGVKMIEDVYGFGRNVKKMITPKGSYAEWHVKKYKHMFPIEIDYNGEVESYEPVEEEKKPLPDFSEGFLF